MAMGIVSDKEFDSESKKLVEPVTSSKSREESNSTIPSAIIKDVNRGRGSNPEVPNSLRNVIGQTSITDGRQEALELASGFGISASSVSAYANGATGTANYNDGPNTGLIGRTKERIAKRARGKLMLALSKLTEEKLEGAKARDLAGIAKDMSAVARSMEESDNPLGPKSNGPTFVFYSPQFRKEEIFDVVHAKE